MHSARTPRKYFKCPAPRTARKLYDYSADDDHDLEKIVFAIIRGTDIARVDPQLYPDITPIIKAKLYDLKEWHQQQASISLQTALDYATNYRYENDPNQLLSFTSRSGRIRSDQITQEDLEECIDLAIYRNDYDSIEPRMQQPLLQELKTRRIQSLQDGDYLLAERYEIATHRVTSLLDENRYDEITIARANDLEQKLALKRDDCDRLSDQWENQISDALDKRDRDIRRLKRKHERELREYDKQFESEPPPERRKFSPAYLQLRAQESYMLSAKRYADATAARVEANALERSERLQQNERWQHELKLRRDELKRRQEDALLVRTTRAGLEVEKMERTASKQIERQQKSASHVETHYAMACSMLRNKRLTRSDGFSSQSRNRKPLPPLGGDETVNKASLFRQRAMINTIIYTRTGNITI